MKVTTVEEMRELDRRAVAEHGIPEQLLMENAGLASAQVIAREIGLAGRSFCVLCGTGNNGGDGLVVARKLNSDGAGVRVLVVGDPERCSEISRVNLESVRLAGIPLEAGASHAAVAAALAGCDVVVDGLLGTGLTREVSGQYRQVIEAVNRSGKRVVSLDIPSGVDGDTGQVRGAAVEAAITVTFGLPKRGNLLYPGAGLGGRLFVTHLSFPPALTASPSLQLAVNLPPPLPPRPADGHKGSFGEALFVAGAANYYGAPSLSALAHLKAGGGYARLAAPRSLVPHLAALASEVVFVPQEESAAGCLAAGSAEPLLALAGAVDLVAVGPGLSLDREVQELVRRLVPAISKPLVVDGDGLTALAADPGLVRQRNAPTVLTPHPGEMARLLGLSPAEVQADRIECVRRAAQELGAVVVLKGARSLIGLPDGRVYLNPTGNSGMATAGSGDVLTGTVTAMLGLGLGVADAVCAAVFVHGLAGDLAAGDLGPDGMTARDILAHLPAAVRDYRERHAELLSDCYGLITVV